MKTEDQLFMQRCLHLANLAKGKTYPNPMVGAVIVHEGKIIGEGYHKKAGTPHAEINAINSVKNRSLLKESTIYVSLEPCAHYGKTPPCAEKITDIGFKRVVIGAMDSHDKVAGKGKAMIDTAGIETEANILLDESRNLNKRFFTYHEKKRPYIILKWAESHDGFMDQNFKPTKISNATVNQLMHQMRSEEHAIFVGTTTALNDNPSLTTRLMNGRNPVRVVLDLDLKIPKHYKIFDQQSDTIIINKHIDKDDNSIKYRKIEDKNICDEIVNLLHKEQIQSLIIEGGAKILQQFVDKNLWDEIIKIKADNLYLKHGTKAPILNLKPDEIKTIDDNYLEYYYKTK